MMMQLATRHKIRLAACLARMVIVSRKLTGKPPEAEFIRRKIRWLLDLREGIDFAIFLFGGFELFSQRAYKRIIQPGSVVFDVGRTLARIPCQWPGWFAHKGWCMLSRPPSSPSINCG
jgi:hypothetical protein